MTPRTTLLAPIHTLLSALTSPPTSPTYISTLLSTFTVDPLPTIHEHGLPQLAPFLGRSFTGTDGVARYFELLCEYLTISGMTFEPEEAWLVDDACMAVVLRGRGRFTWKATGQGWDETFIYRVAVAEEVSDTAGASSGSSGGGSGSGDFGSGDGEGVDMARTGISRAGGKGVLKVVEYRVWADTGAAYLARYGRLVDLMGERGGVEGIYFADGGGDEQAEERKMEGRETRGSLSRKRSGHQDVLGSGLSVYGSCG
ncbi:uncharacterized protein N7458_001617 [Penicillium daleae]|uniref:SnoaL-like domain-containing protein n=1 Tax=Penicillium daleae TaxID=63821 RepID=A0AAD6CB69_9EURO|nr:uncharacterized protein N7458_001617 [Penicillium daleae]KAJ5460065.1 hypothetical protein N7458_001617 [Penicillium daleae]